MQTSLEKMVSTVMLTAFALAPIAGASVAQAAPHQHDKSHGYSHSQHGNDNYSHHGLSHMEHGNNNYYSHHGTSHTYHAAPNYSHYASSHVRFGNNYHQNYTWHHSHGYVRHGSMWLWHGHEDGWWVSHGYWWNGIIWVLIHNNHHDYHRYHHHHHHHSELKIVIH